MISMKRIIVSDAGPIITLEKLTNGFDFIRLLFDELLVPPTVLIELSQGQFQFGDEYLERFQVADLIRIVECKKIIDLPDIQRLDQGEMEAITLAYQMKLPLLIEETIGRHIASNAGLKISGIAGQIIRANRKGIIDKRDAHMKLKELFDHGRINRKIYNMLNQVLK